MKKTAVSPIPQKPAADNSAMALRKIIAISILCVILLASLLACGYFGAKTLRRSQQRRAAMAAYEKKEYETAERLLRAYVRKDPNSEPEFVALANIYREFGNAGLEAQMWQTASSLNPLSDEYRENMLTSAAKSASYKLLHSILTRKIKVGEPLTDQELYLYVIASYRTGYQKDGDDAFKKAVESDPEAFHKNDLGQMAEFMANYSSLSEGERNEYLNDAMDSKDPLVRFEAIYTAMTRASDNDPNDGNSDEVENLLKRLVEVNYYAATPILADFYYSRARFEDTIAVAKPYLKTIDNFDLYLLYAESCVFTGNPDALMDLEKKLLGKSGSMRLLADYCGILIAYLEDDRKLAEKVRKSTKIISSPLFRFIHLRVAMEQDSFSEIVSVAEALFAYPPFHDLHNRAFLVCRNYLEEQMQKQSGRDDIPQLAELARILAGYAQGDRLLTDIILFDQYKKGLVKEADLLAALEQFPDDLLLLQITAEYLLFNDKAELALSLLEQGLSNGMDNRRLDFLHMLALDQMEQHDEAAVIFRRLVEQSEFDLDLLARYFNFCREHERASDLSSMADKLESASDDNLKPLAAFFRGAMFLLEDDEAKNLEALKMLAATPNDNPDFTFYAANRLSDADMLDEAEAKYQAILKTYSRPPLILVNLSEVYKGKGKADKALEAAKEAYDLERKSMLPTFIYAQRLSEAGRFEEAVDVLKFPRHEVSYRTDVVELWVSCMKHVIENSIRDRKIQQAEDQCKHLLLIVPEDEFGKENLEKVREILHPKKDKDTTAEADGAPAA